MRRISILLLVLMLFLLCHSPLYAAEKSPPLILRHADQLETNLDNENLITNLNGNVWFTQGELDVKSKRAVWYKSAGQVVLTGSAVVQDTEHILKGERIIYYEKSGMAVATGDVSLWQFANDARITSQKGEYDRQKKYGLFTQNPKLQLGAASPDSVLTVTARKLEFYSQEEIGIATDSVYITKGSLSATCSKATWYNKDSLIVLVGFPQARQNQDELSGDSISLYLKNKKLDSIQVYGRAKASQKLTDSTTFRTNESFLTSQQLTFQLQDDEVRKIVAIDQATSLYIPSAGDSVDITKNQVSGDTIYMDLDSGQVTRVLVKGGAQGQYLFISEDRKQDSLPTEDTVTYRARDIDYQVENKIIQMKGGSYLEMGEMNLTSGKIEYNLNNKILVAEGVTDSESTDSSLTDTPVLYDGEEQITGQRMVYNLGTREGRIVTGKTKFEKGFYYGQKFYKVGEREFLASRGYFTTCDLTPPHFHFFSSKMKLIPEDKIITQPLVLEIADVPIAGLPFYVFPIKPDRHSGFLTFEIGNFTGLNRFVRNLGYYWAFSEYMDVEAAMDIYEEEGMVLRGMYRYAVRNLLSGYVSGSFKRQSSWNLFNYTLDRSYRWDLNFSHSHQISESIKLAGSGTFLSDNSYYRDFNLNPAERRNRVLRSQINLSKRWSQAGGNLALEQNSDLDRNTETWLAPAFNFNKFSAQLFPVKTSETSVTPRWYNLIYYSFNSNWRNFISTAEDTAAGVDSAKHYLTADQRGSLSFNPKLFGFLNLKPQMRFQESWYYIFSTNQSANAQILTGKLAGRGSVNFSLDASTNLYGTFPVSVLGLQGIRHVFTPAVSYSWQPETDQHAQLRSFTGIGPFSSKSQVMGFSAGNVFLIKTKSERKLELFSLIFGSSYNFLATSHKLGNLRTSLRSAAVPNFDFQFNAEHDFYDLAGLDLNVFNPRLLNFDINTNINLHRSASTGLDTTSADYATARKGWRVYLSHRYSENTVLGAFGKNHWMGINSEFWATANWKINYSARYDFINREMAEQIVEIYRDLHCWEARISWIPSGFRQGFYFRINIKALPEIKFEKGGAGLGSAFY